ncbi:MAG: SDR family oxidoreductase [Acidimicrobiales bacterium]|nr:SDR family oxidoreductase [Acidimicrobiales bacterium]MYG87059.1 SDR family oxidoreductase [Acidimicrobiales bacterium]MYI27021.1 SDR family oxidoreductase [Acidimicrobiales bacterium]
MDLQLAGKNVLVTGAGQGLGLAIAEAFAGEGANVAFAYNASSEGAEKGAAAAQEAGRTALAVRCDVTSQDDVERTVGQVVSTLGSIDVLVNNAAYTNTGPFVDAEPDELQRMVDVTVMGTLRMTQAVVRHMVDTGSAGSIVSLMGDSGRVGESRLAGVATTRASTTGLMKSVAKEFGRNGIRANTVSLGLVRSERFADHTGNADDERMARIAKMYPLRRVGVPADVPPMVLLLASPLSSWITGQTVSVNGGYSMV